MICKPVSRENGNRMFWLASLTHRCSGGGSQSRRMSGTDPVINAETDWAVVSFHTVPAEELIEERPDDSREAGTRQMKYLGK